MTAQRPAEDARWGVATCYWSLLRSVAQALPRALCARRSHDHALNKEALRNVCTQSRSDRARAHGMEAALTRGRDRVEGLLEVRGGVDGVVGAGDALVIAA